MHKRHPYSNPYSGLDSPDAEGGDAPASPVVDNNAVAPPPLAEVADEELVRACKARVCPDCPVLREAEDVKLRALADLENTRKRLAREKEEFSRFAGESVIADILPALDNLDLALAHAPKEGDCKNFVIGVEMTRKLLLDSLSRHGLAQLGELGEAFDPAVHEAVGMEAHTEFPEGAVCGLLSRGYRLKDRLLRPAKVTVCKF